MRGLEGINLIAADIVEVAPAYDTNAELTTMAAAVGTIYTATEALLTAYPGCLVRSHDIDGHEGSAQWNGFWEARNNRALVKPSVSSSRSFIRFRGKKVLMMDQMERHRVRMLFNWIGKRRARCIGVVFVDVL
jgi:hypothetical protein